jgi:nucleoside-diphosphate-sugar epimerase
MRVVVVGATGNIGTSLVEVLAADEQIDTIVGVARRRPQWQPPKTSWIQADVCHDDLAKHFRGADAVVQLAWIFQPTHDEVATWRNNVLGRATP